MKRKMDDDEIYLFYLREVSDGGLHNAQDLGGRADLHACNDIVFVDEPHAHRGQFSPTRFCR
jgi:hypothetical protein